MIRVILILVILLTVLTALTVLNRSTSGIDRYMGIGGGSPGFVSYAIRSGSGPGGCGCGYDLEGRPYCDLTGPVSYS